MIEVLITAAARGRWTLKVEPGNVDSARDSLDMLERTGCVNYADVDLTTRILNILENSR
jgi:hypothetical protein